MQMRFCPPRHPLRADETPAQPAAAAMRGELNGEHVSARLNVALTSPVVFRGCAGCIYTWPSTNAPGELREKSSKYKCGATMKMAQLPDSVKSFSSPSSASYWSWAESLQMCATMSDEKQTPVATVDPLNCWPESGLSGRASNCLSNNRSCRNY